LSGYNLERMAIEGHLLSHSYFANPHVNVYFLGFKSSFRELSSQGWRIGVEKTGRPGDYIFYMQHDALKLTGMSHHYSMNFGLAMDGRIDFDRIDPVIIRHVCQTGYIRSNYFPMNIRTIETEFKICEERFYSYDTGWFMPADNDLILPPQNVSEAIELVLKLQEPKQREITHERWNRLRVDKLKSQQVIGNLRVA
jgi:hypothetical protein